MKLDLSEHCDTELLNKLCPGGRAADRQLWAALIRRNVYLTSNPTTAGSADATTKKKQMIISRSLDSAGVFFFTYLGVFIHSLLHVLQQMVVGSTLPLIDVYNAIQIWEVTVQIHTLRIAAAHKPVLDLPRLNSRQKRKISPTSWFLNVSVSLKVHVQWLRLPVKQLFQSRRGSWTAWCGYECCGWGP